MLLYRPLKCGSWCFLSCYLPIYLSNLFSTATWPSVFESHIVWICRSSLITMFSLHPKHVVCWYHTTLYRLYMWWMVVNRVIPHNKLFTLSRLQGAKILILTLSGWEKRGCWKTEPPAITTFICLVTLVYLVVFFILSCHSRCFIFLFFI